MQTQSHHVALIVVDVQNGFTPGGNLAVAKADQIIPIILCTRQKKTTH